MMMFQRTARQQSEKRGGARVKVKKGGAPGARSSFPLWNKDQTVQRGIVSGRRREPNWGEDLKKRPEEVHLEEVFGIVRSKRNQKRRGRREGANAGTWIALR